MFANNGYVCASRSVRSAEAIENFEVPMSMVNRDLINAFLHSSEADEPIEFAEKLPVTIWKYALKRAGASSWHHTSSFYNKADHYDLQNGLDYINKNQETIKDDYKNMQDRVKKNKKEEEKVEYAVSEIQIWGGSRKRPKMLGTEKVYGQVKNGWLIEDSGQKHKLAANKAVSTNYYSSLKELKKGNKELFK